MMKRISFRDVKADVAVTQRPWEAGGEGSTYPSAFPENPFNPNTGGPGDYSGITSGWDEAPQCPQCKVNLLVDDKKDIGKCPNCNSRFSKMQYDSAYSERAMHPGLFNLDGSNTNNPGADGAGPNYHASDSIYGGNSVWSNPAASNRPSNY